MIGADLGLLELLSKNTRYRRHLKEAYLLNPCLNLFSDLSEKTFPARFQQVRCMLADTDGLDKLLELRLLTEVLLAAHKSPEGIGRRLGSWMDPAAFLPVDIRRAVHEHWAAVPVWLVGEDRILLRYFIAGFLSGDSDTQPWPPWADRVMASSSKEAVKTALDVVGRFCPSAKGKSFFCYPLTIPNDRIQIEGRSLALSLALAFRGLLLGRKANERIAATGDLDRDGHVIQVDRLPEKMKEAVKRFNGMLFPSQNLPAPFVDGLELLPVSGFEQAALFWDLYSPGSRADLLLFSEMLESPAVFAANCDNVPPVWLAWAVENDKTTKLTDAVVGSPGLFQRIADRLEVCANQFRIEQGEAIRSLVPARIQQEIEAKAPLATFRWRSANLALVNHCGDVAGAAQWKQGAFSLLGRVRKMDVEAAATFLNHFFVSLHNGYHFRPDLPEDLPGVLRCLEVLHKGRRDFGCAVYPVLGRLYGTIAQNYGFCGPDFLSYTEQYSRKALAALGEGIVPEFKDEWLRQYNYLTYAYLDAGRWEEAKKTLFVYLQIGDWADLWSMKQPLSAWQHAVLARFMADTALPEPRSVYLERTAVPPDRIVEQSHPLQLWTWNMGRIALNTGDRVVAEDFFSRSLAICFSERVGPTVGVMALLPLCGLQKLEDGRGLTKAALPGIERKIRQAATRLNQDHFDLLRRKTWEEILEMLWDSPQMLFPFAYR